MPKSFKFSLVLKGILVSSLFALVLTLFLSLILAFTSIPESTLSYSIIFGISVFLGAALTSYQAGTKGLYYGLAVGVGFVLFLLLLSSILNSTSPAWQAIGEKTIVSVVSSAIGGISGAIFKR